MGDLDASCGFARGNVTYRGLHVGVMQLEVPGRVNALNALGALAAANWAGVPGSRALSILRDFHGVKRRFEVLGSIGGVPLVDDYAHHPTAVKQLLETARATWAGRNLLAVFQAHQYQRINTFMPEFADALALADRVLIARTYAARESDVIPGEPEERLARMLRQKNVAAMAYSDFASITNDITLKAMPSDVVLFIGAGDVNQVATELLDRRKYISDRIRAIARPLAGSAA
jgi:UDP-N-acetylmuramate--alanine ligase